MRSAFSSRTLDAPERRRLLETVAERIRGLESSGRRPSIVFDLDGTLMDNRPRVAAILRELAAHWHAQHPQVAERMHTVSPGDIVYDIHGNLARLGVTDPPLREEGAAFWHQRFFTDPYIRHDVALPGSVGYVQRLYRDGANIVYLTGRDLPRMALGTFASLRDLGFPIGVVGTELVTKPDFATPDAAFKQAVAMDLRRAGEVVAHFDNEPANCNLLRAAYPEALAVFVDTLHAPNPPDLDAEVQVIDSFELT